MPEDRRALWDQRHATADGLGTVAAVLRHNQHLIPPRGRALDMACGRGANVLWLAQLFPELVVYAWDYSSVAIERLTTASRSAPNIEAQVRDVLVSPPQADGFDLVIVANFLERDLVADIVASLRPGGRLFYQSFTIAGATLSGPTDPRYRLCDNELLRLFSDLELRYYREDRELRGERDLRGLALMVAERRP